MKLIIQVPCYNEAQTLEIALNHLPKHIDGIDEIEYLIINDGSRDDTVKVAKNWGVNYVVNFRTNRGLAKGFMAGLDACLRNGADIIVNTDADDQYCGDDIEKLVRPILEEKADIVIGERPIDDTEHFSPLKKKLQHFGSWTVRVASKSDIPDAPSGFRAYSRDAAMRLNVTNEYTYTLETIIQAGRTRMAMESVPIRTNPELRKSRLFSSMFGYVKRSMVTIVRSFMMYKRCGSPRDRQCALSLRGTAWCTISVLLCGRIRKRSCAVLSLQYPDADGLPDRRDRTAGRHHCGKPQDFGRCTVSCT